eukprot:2730632-Prymnesium_polylepis.1
MRCLPLAARPQGAALIDILAALAAVSPFHHTLPPTRASRLACVTSDVYYILLSCRSRCSRVPVPETALCGRARTAEPDDATSFMPHCYC